MEIAREVIKVSMHLRSDHKISIKQPIRSLTLIGCAAATTDILTPYLSYLSERIRVQEILLDPKPKKDYWTYEGSLRTPEFFLENPGNKYIRNIWQAVRSMRDTDLRIAMKSRVVEILGCTLVTNRELIITPRFHKELL